MQQNFETTGQHHVGATRPQRGVGMGWAEVQPGSAAPVERHPSVYTVG